MALLVRKIDGFYNNAQKNQRDESTQGERTPYSYRLPAPVLKTDWIVGVS